MDIKKIYKLYQQHPCITTDSRECPEGSIFLALRGASFNGNEFALAALQKGCSYAIVDEDIAAESDNIIRVDDCLQTYNASIVGSSTSPSSASQAPTARRPPRSSSVPSSPSATT